MQIVLYIWIIVAGMTFILTIQNGLDSFAMTPDEMRFLSDCNTFGIWCQVILAILINPISAILRFLYWIFHVRKDD